MPRYTTPLSPKQRAIIEQPAYQERFWSYVDKTGDCWLWKGGRFGNGYGAVRVAYLTTNAHRIAWEIVYGPAGEQWVLHKCDKDYPPGDFGYRLCVRPDHLYLGTPLQNAADRESSGRRYIPLARDHATAILDEASVLAIRVCYATGRFTHDELGAIFGVPVGTVGQVARGEDWAWVTVPDSVQVALERLTALRGPAKRLQTTLWDILAEQSVEQSAPAADRSADYAAHAARLGWGR